MIVRGDCLEVLRGIDPDSVDSIVTDPPAGISFMGKEWDKSHGFIPSMTEIFKECVKVLKPGAHGFVWAIPRTSHWTATALENAGFEIRDVVTHLFGSGFPKSMDISKAIDKQAGAERAVLRTIKKTPSAHSENMHEGYKRPWAENHPKTMNITAPATLEAKHWQGWGTALKPASEHWILVRKPCSEKTVAANVLKWSCGGLNIDQSRIGTKPGRFPSNLILSHNPDCVVIGSLVNDEEKISTECTPDCAVAALDEQSGTSKSTAHKRENSPCKNLTMSGDHLGNTSYGHDDHGGASRFFLCVKPITENIELSGARFRYCAKTSKSERNAGCDGLETKASGTYGEFAGDGRGRQSEHQPTTNHHPTVKPKKLMDYLIRMITPPGGLVLDPFAGSGSTGVAAIENGFQFVGIEKEDEYATIAESRIQHALNTVSK